MKEVKILKEKSREYKGTPYYKYKINIPETILSLAGFKAGDILEIEAFPGSIRVKKAEKREN
jgi:bifunctional DNA-binding transcriptional regulator/antitoxin component of YhaV-PrlF toxin-antitoxin module